MWWLLGEPPPWARRDYFTQNITNFSFLAMPSVETTANHSRHTTISTTSSNTRAAEVVADTREEVSVDVAGETSDSTVLAPMVTSRVVISASYCLAIELMKRFPTVLHSTTRAALFMSLLMDNMARELMSLQVFLTPSSLKKISQRDGDLGDITRYWT
jgi:hypothetical protein